MFDSLIPESISFKLSGDMFNRNPRVVSALMLTATVSMAGRAQQDLRPFISPMFTSNMVLQRGMKDPVWGWAAPGTAVTVSINGQDTSTTAGSDGKWQVKVGPLPVGGPYTMTVTGPQTIKFDNILVGDVWICSGQSNMEMGVGNLKDPDATISAANYPTLRLYAVPKMISAEALSSTSGNWQECTPTALRKDGDWGGFSAAAYFFGKKLNEDLKVPIGLIHTSWGGTPAEAWTSEKELGDHLPEFQTYLAQLDTLRESRKHKTENGIDPFAEWYQKNDPGTGTSAAWAAADLNDSSWKSLNLPGFVQDSGIPELKNPESVFWLRRTVELTADQAAQAATLNFVADDNDTTWVNGVKVGATEGWNTPRQYKIPSGTLHSGSNSISVRVTDTSAPGGIYGDPNGLFLQVGGEKVSLVGSWKVKLGVAISAKNALPATIQQNPNFPSVLYNGMIQPLVPYGVKGAIWYQGESNAGKAFQYRTLLPTMIESWHKSWGQGSFPFLIVQLAGFGHPATIPGDDAWAELREAQFLTTKKVKNAGIMTAVDIGEENDIHPKNKMEVGRRLALVAEASDYHMKVESSGPVYKSMRVEGGAVRISFEHAKGLQSVGGNLKGFIIAGADHKWTWADAKIDGNSVIVSAASVPNPVAVRYSWASFSDSNLANGERLPAFPFRTDDWKGITGGK